MRACLSFFLLSAGCCFAGAPAAPAMPVGPSGPAAPGCPDLGATIVGTWAREGFVEEYRAGGVYVLNGLPGTYRFLSPGHAVLDVPPALHAEYDFALTDATTLVAVDPSGVGTSYVRTSPTPSIPAACLDLRAVFARTWRPVRGGSLETYSLDGTYAAPGHGTWTFPSPGRLRLVRDDGVTSEYLVGMPTPTRMIAMSLPPLPPTTVVYDATP